MRLHIVAACALAALAQPAVGHSIAGAQRSLRAAGPAPHDALGGSLSTEGLKKEEPAGSVGALLQQASEADLTGQEGMEPTMCKSLICLVFAAAIMTCCCQICLGPAGALLSLVNIILEVAILVHLINEGLLHKVFAGEPVGGWCLVLSIWAMFSIFAWMIRLCAACIIGVVLGGTIIAAKKIEEIKNEAVRQVRAEFDKMSEDLPDNMKQYYMSQEFRDKCDKLFRDADKDGNGTLDLKELRETVMSQFSERDDIIGDHLFVLAFDANGNSEIEQDEFYEMMKYFDMKFKIATGKMPTKSAPEAAPAQPALENEPVKV